MAKNKHVDLFKDMIPAVDIGRARHRRWPQGNQRRFLESQSLYQFG